MSKFLKALEQAQRDRALAAQGTTGAARPEAPSAAVRAGAPPPRAPRAPEPPAPPPLEEEEAPPPRPFRRPAIPRPPAETQGVDDHLVSLVAPTAFEAEQYRALRYVVEQRHRTDNLTVVAVSSAGIGDGKTTTAINLAGALAQAPEARVLLIEADLRRPSIGPQLGLDPSGGAGLVHAILDPRISLAEVTRRQAPFNLNVILAGQAPPSPYEILKSPHLVDLLDEARTAYDYVILDTPPLVAFQDSRVITRWVDGIIVVVGAHRTPRRLLEEALNVLDPTKMLGFVFNGDDRGLARFYGRHADPYRPSNGRARARRRSWRRGEEDARRPLAADGDGGTE